MNNSKKILLGMIAWLIIAGNVLASTKNITISMPDISPNQSVSIQVNVYSNQVKFGLENMGLGYGNLLKTVSLSSSKKSVTVKIPSQATFNTMIHSAGNDGTDGGMAVWRATYGKKALPVSDVLLIISVGTLSYTYDISYASLPATVKISNFSKNVPPVLDLSGESVKQFNLFNPYLVDNDPSKPTVDSVISQIKKIQEDNISFVLKAAEQQEGPVTKIRTTSQEAKEQAVQMAQRKIKALNALLDLESKVKDSLPAWMLTQAE